MLPSGNDAAFVLAENFGYIIKQKLKNNYSVIEKINQTN
jgi:hypothetical protein